MLVTAVNNYQLACPLNPEALKPLILNLSTPAVGVVVLVTAVNNYQKERQFRLLQAVSEDAKVGGALPPENNTVSNLACVPHPPCPCTAGGPLLAATGRLHAAGDDARVCSAAHLLTSGRTPRFGGPLSHPTPTQRPAHTHAPGRLLFPL